MGRFSLSFRAFIAWVMCILSVGALAQMPTQAQIEQFQRMPPQQQRALAQQFGVDINQFQLTDRQRSSPESSDEPTLRPRDRQEDDQRGYQNPLFDTERDQDNELKPFGYDIFESEPTSYAPLNDVPVPSDYMVAPGDEIVIQLYGKADVNNVYRLIVGRDGTIDFPNLGSISVSGMPFSQLQPSLAERIKSQILGVKISVSMGQLRTIQVVVTGEAYKPGSYLLNGLSTVTQAITAAGGFKETGSLRNIQVKRNGNLIRKIDLYDLLLKGRDSFDVRLQSGDVVWVGPVGQRVAVSGEVTRPGIYEINRKETLSSVLSMAGGTRAEALLNKILVERRTDKGVSVSSKDALSAKDNDFLIKGGDEIIVPAKNTHYVEAVSVRGAVLKQGFFPVFSGMRISDIFSSFDRDIGVAADLNYALLIRSDQYGANIKVNHFSLANILKNKHLPENFELQARDELWFFSNNHSGDAWSKTREQSKKVFSNERESFERFQLGRFPNRLENNLNNQQWQNDERLSNLRPQRSESALETVGEDRTERSYNRSNTLGDSSQLTDSRVLSANTNAYDGNRQQLPESVARGSNRSPFQNEYTSQMYPWGFDGGKNTIQNPYSRQAMLPSLLEKLRNQASPENPLKLVEIRGAVKYPGPYPLSEGAKLSDLVLAAGGFEEKSYPDEAELSRYFLQEGEIRLRHRRIKLPSSVEYSGSDALNIVLQSKDKINIFTRPEWRDEINVELLGEVSFPGVYSMQRGETLSELIDRAGGITGFGYTNGAVFSRESLRLQEQKRMRYLSQQLRREVGNLVLRRQQNTSFSPKEALEVLDQLGDEQAIGRMVINLDKAISKDSQYDIVLEDGDRLVIPSYRPEIQIVGQVQFASNHIFDESLSLKDYVRLAGGYKRQADKRRVYIIRADGAVMMPKRHNWFKRRKAELQPGDTVVVPLNISYMDGFSVLSSASQLVNQVALSAAAFANLSRD